jgi:hypothetical protein
MMAQNDWYSVVSGLVRQQALVKLKSTTVFGLGKRGAAAKKYNQ